MHRPDHHLRGHNLLNSEVASNARLRRRMVNAIAFVFLGYSGKSLHRDTVDLHVTVHFQSENPQQVHS
jgi:hypothetical protein